MNTRQVAGLSSTRGLAAVHVNSVLVVGRVGKNLPKVQYASNGNPTCTYTLEVDEPSKSGETFTLFLPVEIWGQAEIAAETLDPGDEVMLQGKLKYKSVVDAKTQVKVSKLMISSWGIAQRQPAPSTLAQEQRTASPEYPRAGGRTGERS
jgi:single-stranded DNA-binding protein